MMIPTFSVKPGESGVSATVYLNDVMDESPIPERSTVEVTIIQGTKGQDGIIITNPDGGTVVVERHNGSLDVHIWCGGFSQSGI